MNDAVGSPATERALGVTDETRIPMSLPHMMLQVPEIPGYVMHWFADRPGRISRALAAGYEYVDPAEVRINNFGLAADLASESGNTDMGTRVSVHGGVSEQGGAERLYLMKVKQEWYDKDMQVREEAADRQVAALRQGLTGAEREKLVDATKRYAKNTDNLFTKKPRRS